MKKLRVLAVLSLFFVLIADVCSQSVHNGLFGGTTTYIGDLSDKISPFQKQKTYIIL